MDIFIIGELPAIFLSVFFLFSCGAQKKSGIIIAGSTSVQPFIEKLADEFMAKRKGVTINVQGGGSTAGIQAALNGTCDIGTSSRHLKPNEEGLRIFLMALDGIVIIVHPKNPINSLTTEKIRDIFAGKINNWQEVGGDNKKIIVVTREEGSGTRGAFEELIMKDTAISDACLVQDSNGAVREMVATTPEAIGYISAGLVDTLRIKALSIDGIPPRLENFISGKYKIVRPFLLLTKEEPWGLTKEFIDYIFCFEAQEILKNEGLIPSKVQLKSER